jgi:hypothetical protein
MKTITLAAAFVLISGAAMGWPILGDAIYGTGAEAPLHLHARAIAIPLYKNKEPVRCQAPAPDHMREALSLCGWVEEPEPVFVMETAGPKDD